MVALKKAVTRLERLANFVVAFRYKMFDRRIALKYSERRNVELMALSNAIKSTKFKPNFFKKA